MPENPIKVKLLEKRNQMRRDFDGLYVCEGCGHEQQIGGCYDDRYFHDNVTPGMKCGNCGKSTADLGLEPARVATRYPEGELH